jgi:hypothetical protein
MLKCNISGQSRFDTAEQQASPIQPISGVCDQAVFDLKLHGRELR